MIVIKYVKYIQKRHLPLHYTITLLHMSDDPIYNVASGH